MSGFAASVVTLDMTLDLVLNVTIEDNPGNVDWGKGVNLVEEDVS